MDTKDIVEVELPDGTVVRAEVRVPDGDVAGFDRFKLNALQDAARFGHWAKEALLDAMPSRPDRLRLQVGINLVVQSGALISVIASASAEASVTVILEWSIDNAP